MIDKDRTSALLAAELDADFLLILAGIEKVAPNFNQPDMREVDCMTVSEAAAYLADGQFPPRSMGPKIEAAMRFAAHSQGCAIITTLASAAEALAGKPEPASYPIRDVSGRVPRLHSGST